LYKIGFFQISTRLAKGVFRHVKEKGKGKTYYDTSDPTPNQQGVPDLIKVLLKSLIDVFSVNENEALFYASYLDKNINNLRKTLRIRQLIIECAKVLAKNVSSRVDLHATRFSGSFTSEKEILVPSFDVHCLRATGAGDAWNAGNILGEALGLRDSCRLTLANAVAACYISNPSGKHPTLIELMEFLHKHQPT
jgi:Sugar kinases, ribokinase family